MKHLSYALIFASGVAGACYLCSIACYGTAVVMIIIAACVADQIPK